MDRYRTGAEGDSVFTLWIVLAEGGPIWSICAWRAGGLVSLLPAGPLAALLPTIQGGGRVVMVSNARAGSFFEVTIHRMDKL